MGVRRPRCSAINHKTHRSRPNHCSPQEFGLGRQLLKVRTGAFEVEREGGGGPNLYLAGARVGGFGAHLIQLTDGPGAAGQLVWEAQLHRHLCHRVKEKTRKCPSDSHQLFPLTHIVRSV